MSEFLLVCVNRLLWPSFKPFENRAKICWTFHASFTAQSCYF